MTENRKGLLLVGAAPTTEGDVLLNIRETAGRETLLTLTDGNGKRLSFIPSDALGEDKGGATDSLKVPPYGNIFVRLTISMADVIASKPLLPALVPARSMACSMVSVVSTP